MRDKLQVGFSEYGRAVIGAGEEEGVTTCQQEEEGQAVWINGEDAGPSGWLTSFSYIAVGVRR